MSGFLLDTNVLSEFNRRGEPDQRVKHWLEAADTESLHARVLTFGEIRFGIELLPPSKRRALLEQWLERDLHEWLKDVSCRLIGQLQTGGEYFVLKLSCRADLSRSLTPLLAATAIQHKLTLVSRNVSDFSDVGLAVVNP